MKHWIWLLPAALILPACVTINIYFPAAAAEKAADKIIDEVWAAQAGAGNPAEARRCAGGKLRTS